MKKLLLFFALTFSASASFGQYCLPTYGNACTSGDFIDGFSFDAYTNLGTGCGAPGVNNFTDNTGINIGTYDQNGTYAVTCAPGPTWGQYFAVWIDFNQDGDFDEVNEFFDIGYSAAGGSVTTNITIPPGIGSGTTRIRVMCHFGTGVINQPDACSAQTWGEVEDYSIDFNPASDYEAAILSIDGPTTGCGLGMETVVATFQNNGVVTADTFIVCYSANGGTWMCDTVTGLGLVTNATYQHSFTDLLDLSVTGDYYIDASVSYVGDTLPANDTIFGYFIQSIPTITGIPYYEDFEAGTGGWTSAGVASNWEHGVLNQANVNGNGGCAIGDSMVWATGLSTPYNANTVAYLESPCIDFSLLTADPNLTFDHIFQVEGTFEDHYVETSIDGGATWTVLGAAGTGLNWYNQPANWDGTSYATAGEWRKAGHTLTGTAGQSDVRIRFVLLSDGSVQQEGIAVDNISIDAATLLVDARPTSLDAPQSGCGLTATEIIIGSFENIGSDSLIGFDVCYSINGGAPICETLGDTIIPGGSYQHTFATSADLSAVGLYTIDFSINASDIDTCNDIASYTVQNKPVISTFPYLETFENGPGGWDAINAANGTWELATPAGATIIGAASGDNAWVTNATGPYNVNDNSSVESPCFDFTSLDYGSWVAMKIWWNSENSWDGANLQISLDTAATWTNIGAFGDPNNWYTDNSINGNPGGSQEGWTGNEFNVGSGGWVTAKHPLDSALVGIPHALFRVTFGSDASVTDDGVAFDNFAIGLPPTINIGSDFAGCANYEIDPALPGTYEWFTLDTAALAVPVLVSTDQIGVYTNTSFVDTTFNAIVIYTDSLGLCAADTAMLTLSPAPFNEFNDTTICYYDSVLYSVDTSSRYTYNWNNGSVVDSSLYIYTSGGAVSVTVTDTVSGCASTTTATIFQTPAVAIADVTVCEGDTAFIDATSLYSNYDWSTGDSVSIIGVVTAGQYDITTIDNIGCMSSDSALVTVNALPTTTITGGVDTLCTYNDVTLDAGAGFADYSWSSGGTAQTETILGTSLTAGSNNVVVTITDGNGCVNTQSTTIFVDPCAGIDELGLNFSVYPNPSTSVFNYEIEGDISNTTLSITNVLGQEIWVENLKQSIGQIDLSTFAPGTYYLKVADMTSSSTVILVKK